MQKVSPKARNKQTANKKGYSRLCGNTHRCIGNSIDNQMNISKQAKDDKLFDRPDTNQKNYQID